MGIIQGSALHGECESGSVCLCKGGMVYLGNKICYDLLTNIAHIMNTHIIDQENLGSWNAKWQTKVITYNVFPKRQLTQWTTWRYIPENGTIHSLS
jgi:hypothetical protein